MQTRHLVETVVELDGARYSWIVHREPQWSSMDGWKGLCIEVRSVECEGRKLLLELPFVKVQAALFLIVRGQR